MHKVLLIAALFCSSLLATEIDSFTLRDSGMQDGLVELNRLAQNYFDQALTKANRANSCDPAVFESAFHKTITGVFWSQIETDIEQSEALDRRTNGRANSIYRDVTIFEGTLLHMARLGFLVKVGDLYIGSDKFGHFLDTGYEYYQKSSLEHALAYGEMTERTYYGLLTTSVYSYGDLAANLDGYNFWNRLTQGPFAYAACKNNTWNQTRVFNWSDYINPAWDESFNCNFYRNAHVTNSVNTQIAALGTACPAAPNQCPEMIAHYGEHARHAVSHECFN